ncbi:ABC transporter ATP-binding protein [Carnobacteriaceae bacterium zg-ZUI78]|nr:ABC transporter ATP-binding protein [Carnobacteriaceae bacterium zg-ZUI78]
MTIQLNHIHKIFQENKKNECVALEDVTLSINKGELVAIVGKSGSGKSTLLHIIGGLAEQSSGTYVLHNEVVTKKAQQNIRLNTVGFVMQDFALIEQETVKSNVALPLLLDKTTSISDIKKRVDETFHLVGIADLKQKKVNQLSGGQKQRVAIARAIVKQAEIILADEPTGSLDTKTGQEILDILKSLHEEGRTVIIVTHDEHIAQQCERIVTLNDGEVVSDVIQSLSYFEQSK